MTFNHSPSALIVQHESAIRILRGALQRAPLFAATAKQLIAEHVRAIQELKAQGEESYPCDE